MYKTLFYLFCWSGLFWVIQSDSLSSSQCISLKGSSVCPHLQNASVNQTLLNSRFNTGSISDISSFDSYLQQVTSLQSISRSFISYFNCSNLTSDVIDYRYSTSFICGVSVSSSSCSPSGSDSYQVCSDTCVQSVQSLQAIVQANCPSIPNTSDFFVSRMKECDIFPTTNCVEGSVIQSNNCGFINSDSACAFCKNSSDDCCKSVANCAIASSSTPVSSNSSQLSTKIIICIVVGVLLGLILLFLIIYYLRKRQNKTSPLILISMPEKGFEPKVAHPGQAFSIPQQATSQNSIPKLVSTPPAVATLNTRQSFETHSQLTSMVSNDIKSEAYTTQNENSGNQTFETQSQYSNFVENSSQVDVPTPYVPKGGIDTRRSSLASTAFGDEGVVKFERYIVYSPFEPTRGDEIKLNVGDMVLVRKVYDDGWGLGMNAETSEIGAFPVALCQPIEG